MVLNLTNLSPDIAPGSLAVDTFVLQAFCLLIFGYAHVSVTAYAKRIHLIQKFVHFLPLTNGIRAVNTNLRAKM